MTVALSPMLDLVLGVLFVFLVFSVVASGAYEIGARVLATRSRLLWKSLRLLLEGERRQGDARPTSSDQAATLTDRLYAHPLIRQLEGPKFTEAFKKSRLSHIDPGDFGRVLIDIVVPAGADATSVDAVRSAVASADLPETLKRSLLPLLAGGANTLDDVRDSIGGWFDSRMTALSRVYRRNTRFVMSVIGIGVAIIFNVNIIGVTNELYRDANLRAAIAAQATSIVDACAGSADVDQCTRSGLDKLGERLVIPVGWGADHAGTNGWQAVGWILTGVAIAQGAPFWFDLLRRTRSLRS